MIAWRNRRLSRWGAVVVVVLVAVAGVGWWSLRELRPCGRLDRWLDRSGCVAVHSVPWFGGNHALSSRPELAFTPDGTRVAMVGTEVQDPDVREPPEGRLYQRSAMVVIDAGSGAVTGRTSDGSYVLGGLVGSFGTSWSGRYAVGVFYDPVWRGRERSSVTEGDSSPTGRVRLWRLDGGPGGWQSPVMDLPARATIVFSVDETRVRTGDGHVWDVRTGGLLPEEARKDDVRSWWRGWGTEEVIRTDERIRARWDARTWSVKLSDVASGRTLRTLPTGLDDQDVTGPWFHFSPSGKRLAMLTGARGTADIQLRVWDIESGERILALASPILDTATAWSPDERLLAVQSRESILGEGGGIALFRIR